MKIISFSLLLISICAFGAKAKKTKTLPPSTQMEIILSESNITIFGDSNLHRWEIKANNFKGSGSFDIFEGKLKDIKNFLLTVDAKEIKGDSDSMNEKIAMALESEMYSQIVCTIKTSAIKEDNLTGTIEFIIHGIKKSFDFNSKVTFSEKALTVEGDQNLLMTDFQIEPPVTKILFLKAKAKPELKIKYKLILKSKN